MWPLARSRLQHLTLPACARRVACEPPTLACPGSRRPLPRPPAAGLQPSNLMHSVPPPTPPHPRAARLAGLTHSQSPHPTTHPSRAAATGSEQQQGRRVDADPEAAQQQAPPPRMSGASSSGADPDLGGAGTGGSAQRDAGGGSGTGGLSPLLGQRSCWRAWAARQPCRWLPLPLSSNLLPVAVHQLAAAGCCCCCCCC
jgi:hypothetical protein